MPDSATPCGGAAKGPPRRHVVWAGPCPPPSRLLALESSGKIGTLQLFLKFFLKVDFLHKKRDTKAILLKTTLVRISCIQNTQVGIKTIAKVFGKVDMFWTYHITIR